MTALRRWGRGLFLAALALLPAGIMLAYRFPPEQVLVLSRPFPASMSGCTLRFR